MFKRARGCSIYVERHLFLKQPGFVVGLRDLGTWVSPFISPDRSPRDFYHLHLRDLVERSLGEVIESVTSRTTDILNSDILCVRRESAQQS